MKELPLCTQPLHNVHALLTEEANVAATDVDRELFSERALWKESTESVFGVPKENVGKEGLK